MGQVYLATAKGLGGFERQVVVKTLESDEVEDDSLVQMFLDEARILGALHHQYIAPVYEVGRDDRGRYFIVMDYVRGETAETVWNAAREGRSSLPMAFSLTVCAAVASALDYAHHLHAPDGTALEIVHRDVSLSNVMIGVDGGVKLIDFGIAKFAHRATKTQIGSLKGKLSYLSPEQILSRPVDHRADIFALGIVLYELTTLARGFEGGSPLITLEKITRGELALPSQLVKDYPRELELIVMKALAIDPELRYQDAGTMGRDLEAYAARAGLTIGHASIAETMSRLFEPTPPGGRRRFARASSDLDLTPVTPIPLVDGDELDPTTDPTTTAVLAEDSPTVPLEPVTPAHPRPALPPPFPTTQAAVAPPPPPPFAIRIGTPASPLPVVRPPTPSSLPTVAKPLVRESTRTDQVRPYRSLTDTPSPRWWWSIAVLALAIVIGIALAIRG
jgi:serine/threonine-protein kinase